ncbi:hypothetical protein [Chitinophaga qingshengii]|uniref:Uncharacterized protein n=1 Tax=Chitinophaga qingshengii TaxID=1569794 RepID=A0ABR7TQG5_9BACT|nr:hypothetical protein [Chitinophaga qingshengii]MBC9932737.1 hypothetical protein [Chitinophaga qingshengii]
MSIRFFCYLLLPFFVACKSSSTVTATHLPVPDTATISNAYPLVTAAVSISPDSGTLYRLGLAPYASYFKFDRSVKNGDLFYKAIEESIKKFTPLKFYVLNNGTGQVVAVTDPSADEVEKFNKTWTKEKK